MLAHRAPSALSRASSRPAALQQGTSRTRLRISNATSTATPLAHLKAIKQHKLGESAVGTWLHPAFCAIVPAIEADTHAMHHYTGLRNSPSTEPSTAVLLEERRCSGESASSSSSSAAVSAPPAGAAAIEHADSIREHAVTHTDGPSVAAATAEELRWLRDALSRIGQGDGHSQHGDDEPGSESTDQQQQQQQQEQRQRQLTHHRQQQRYHQQQQLRRRRRSAPVVAPVRTRPASFAEWSAYCQLHASSPLMPHWIQGEDVRLPE